MDRITETAGQIGERMQTSSEIQQSKSPRNTPTRDEVTVLLALINRARALNGWKMQDEAALEKRMLVWWDVLRQYRIPLEAYKELFDMAFDERQRQIGEGKDPKDWIIDGGLLVSCWTRPHGLRAKIEERRIESGRILPDTAASQCPRCLGTGIEMIYDIDGSVIGSRAGRQCEHTPVVEGEGLWARMERDKRAARPHAVERQ